MWRLDTTQAHVFVHYIGSLCTSLPYMNITLYLHSDLTGIRESLNAMKRSIELCLL